MTYGAQKNKELPRLVCPRNHLLFLRAQRHGRVPHGLTPSRGKCIVLLYPSEHRGPILSTLSEPLSKQLVSDFRKTLNLLKTKDLFFTLS
jgi:hypothetical protein